MDKNIRKKLTKEGFKTSCMRDLFAYLYYITMLFLHCEYF